jgi:hypothetical protein
MQIDERILADGQVVPTTLVRAGAHLELRDGDAPLGRLPVLAVERVFARFARELDPDPGLRPPRRARAGAGRRAPAPALPRHRRRRGP